MRSLQSALLTRDKKRAQILANELQRSLPVYFPTSKVRSFFRWSLSVATALAFAILIRQSFFELYEVPSGSMRPSLMEGDKLLVLKNHFSINVPLKKLHFYFDKEKLSRLQIVTFTGQDLPINDVKTRYFYIFPGYKQYVKRLIGKPGDTLYFYGGKIYGIDENGRDISPELQKEEFSFIEHIPFLQFERARQELSPKGSPRFIFTQSREPLATIEVTPQNGMYKSLIHSPDRSINDFYDFWGIKNFGMARIVTKNQLRAKNLPDSQGDEIQSFLQIIHHPSIFSAKLERDGRTGRPRPVLGHEVSYLPLTETLLRKIASILTTSRFVIGQDGRASREGLTGNDRLAALTALPKFSNIPSGRYEFLDGKLYRVGWQYLQKELPPSHPLASFNKEHLETLFNIGIEWDLRILSSIPNLSAHHPGRYIYFRDGSLYLMNQKLLDASDPALCAFIHHEREKALTSSPYRPYQPFIDEGAPLLSNGELDTQKVRNFGLKVPKGHYFMLGDNHANSADSREFGFVPECNLKGTPSFIFWTPGDRFGAPIQPSNEWITLPKVVISTLLLILYLVWKVHQRRRLFAPINDEEFTGPSDKKIKLAFR